MIHLSRDDSQRAITRSNSLLGAFLVLFCTSSISVAGAGDPKESGQGILPVLTRWERLPTFQLKIRTAPATGRVAKDSEESLWDEEVWEPSKRDSGSEAKCRFRRADYELEFDLQGANEGEAQEIWMSHVGGEFVTAVDPTSMRAFAEIRPGMDAIHLSLDKVLTPLEHQFFDFGETWASVLSRLKFVHARDEFIDGRSCWKLENSALTDKYRAELWLCPELDFAPTRAVLTITHPKRRSSLWQMRVTEHIPIGNSWVAKRAIIALTRDDISFYQMSAFEVIEVTVGEDYEPRSVLEKLRAGTRVTDITRGQYWFSDGQGGREGGGRIDTDEQRRVAEAIGADRDRPVMKRTRQYGILAIALATVVIVIGLVMVKRRMTVQA